VAAAAKKGGQVVRHMKDGGHARLDVSPGGQLSGPGTGTSDSIPANLSNKEFVVNAEDAAKNLQLLHDINSGKDVRGYAGGGPINDPGSSEVAGAAFTVWVAGIPYQFDDKADADKFAAENQPKDQSKNKKHHSEFHPVNDGAGYALGGLVGDRARHFAKGGFADRLAGMGLGGTIDVPHLAIGGMPDFSPPKISSSALNSLGANGGGLHPLTVHLPSGDKIDGLHAEPDAVKQLQRAANSAKRSSTGSKPSWYGGGGR
jgi:hypothetical protein